MYDQKLHQLEYEGLSGVRDEQEFFPFAEIEF